MLSWRRGAGNICLPTPSIYISLSFPSHLWLVVAVAVFAERNQRRSEPLSRSTAIRNANVSHLPQSLTRVSRSLWVGLGLLSPREVEVREDLQQHQKENSFLFIKFHCNGQVFLPSFPQWPWSNVGLVHAGLALGGPGPARPGVVEGGYPGADEGDPEADCGFAPHPLAQEVEAGEARDARLIPRYERPVVSCRAT